MPLLLKVEQELAGSKIRFDYYGLPSGFGKEPEAVKYGIGGVPTAILIDETGTILEYGAALRNDRLRPTLEQVLADPARAAH